MSIAKSLADPIPGGGRIRWLRMVGIGLLGLLFLAVTVLTWVISDTDRVRRTVESIVSELGDRPFRIDGEFEVQLGRIITVRAGKIRWLNSPASLTPYMLEIEQFTGSIDLLSLLDLPIVITDVQVSNANLLFEWDEGNGFNWRLGPVEEQKPNPPKRPDPLPLVIDKASVQNVSIRFRHPALTEELEVILTSAEHQQDEANRLEITAAALLEGRELSIDGYIGPFPELAVAGAVDFDVVIAGQIATLVSRGNFASLRQLSDPHVVAQLSAPSATELARRLKLPLETTGKVQLQLNIIGESNSITASSSGSFGEFEVDARYRSDSLRSLQGLDVTVRSAGPSIGDLATIAGLPGLPDTPYEFEARARRTDQGLELQRFLLDTKGLKIHGSGIAKAMPELRDIDLELTATGSNFTTVAELFKLDIKSQLPFRLDAVITSNKRGQNDAIDASLKLGGATARVTGSISEAVDFSGSELQYTVDAPDANELAGIVGIMLPSGSGLRSRGSSSVTTQRISFDDFQFSLDGAELTGKGWLERASEQPRFGFDGQIKGPNLTYLVAPLLPEAVRSTLPKLDFAARARLRMAAGRLDIDTIEAHVGETELGFNAKLHQTEHGLNLSGDITARGDSLSQLLGKLVTDYVPDQAFSLQSRLRMSPAAIRFDSLRFTGQGIDIGGSLGFAGKGYSRIEFDLAGSADNLTDVIPAGNAYQPADVPFSMTVKGATDLNTITINQSRVKLDNTRLALSGELQLQPTLAAKGVRLSGSGPRLSDLGAIGSWKLSDQPFEISASVQGNAGELIVDDLKLTSLDNDLSGRLRFLDKQHPLIEISFKSNKLNLDEIRALDSQEKKRMKTEISQERLFSNEPLPFKVLDSFDASLSLQFVDVVIQERQLRNLIVEASLKGGLLEIPSAQVDTANGKLKVHGTLKPASAGRTIDAEIHAANAMIALRGMTQQELDQLPHHAIAAQLTATGATARELATSLDGYAWVIGGQGQIPRFKIGPLLGDFTTELLSAVNPFEKTAKYSRIDCQGAYFEIDNGKIETSPAIVVRTDQVLVLAEGKVDLVSEKIDFTFQTTPLRGIGVSLGDYLNPFTKVVGTLRNPRITVNPKGAVVEGSAAVATYGLTILAKSLWKRWFGSRQICEKIAEQAAKIRRERDPGRVPDLNELTVGSRRPEAPAIID